MRGAGAPRKHLIRDRVEIDIETMVSVMAQLCDALQYAHRKDVIHRDIKPGNIILTRDGVKLLDFGLAKSTAKPGPADATIVNSLTTEGTVLGTPQYMAPEQFEGKEADARSDIWAFGAVLYEILTGHPPFEGVLPYEIVGKVLTAPIVPPQSLEAGAPAELSAVVMKALTRDRDRRYQRAGALAEEMPAVSLRVLSPVYSQLSSLAARLH